MKDWPQTLPSENINLFRYRPDIDGLRGVAVLAVLLFHLDKNLLPGGFTGVDIFFVISGFVVTNSILTRDSKNVFEYLLEFYARRIRRILPALIICIIGTVLLTALLIPPSEAEKIYTAGLTAILGFSNLYFLSASNDYFSLEMELNPFTQTWSLGVEEQFYLVLPFFLLIVFGLQRPVQRPRQRYIYTLMGVMLLTSLTVSSLIALLAPDLAYYSMPSRFWELASGSTLLVFCLRGTRLPQLLRGYYLLIWQLGAVVLIVLGLTITPSNKGFPLPWAILAVLGTLIFLATGTEQKSYLNKLLSTPQIVYIGKISYSLYLWHWPIFSFFRWTIELNTLLHQAIALTLVCFCALTSYYGIEKPIRKWNPKPIKTILILGFAGIIFTGASTVFISNLFNIFYSSKVTNFPEKWWPRSCHLKSFKPDDIERCLDSRDLSNKYTRTIYLIGDSHAANYMDMIKQLELSHKIAVKEITIGGGCAFMPPEAGDSRTKDKINCLVYNSSLINYFSQKTKKRDIIITSINQQHFSGDIKYHYDIKNTQKIIYKSSKKLDRYVIYLHEFGTILDRKGAALVLVSDVPQLKKAGLTCIPHWGYRDTSCGVEKKLSKLYAEPVERAYAQVDALGKNVYFANMYDFLCDDLRCNSYLGELPLFYDRGHITRQASKYLSPNFIKFLKKNKLL